MKTFQAKDGKTWTVTVGVPQTGEGDVKPEDAVGFRDLLDQRTQSANSRPKDDAPKADQPAKEDAPAKGQETSRKPQEGEQAEDDVPVVIQEDPQALYRRLLESGALAQAEVQYADDVPEEIQLTVEAVEPEMIVAPEVVETEAPQVVAEARPERTEARPDVVRSVETEAQPEEQVQVRPVEAEAEAEARPEVRAQSGDGQRDHAVPVQVGEEQSSWDDEVQVVEAEQAPQPVFRDVEAAPIKVGESTAAEQTDEAPDVDVQVGTQLVQALAQGEDRVEIQLTPENLGTVKVEIVRTVDGVLHVAISAQESQTRGLLEKHAAGLQGLLAQRTEDNVQVEVQHQEESQQHRDGSYEGHNGQGQQQQERRHGGSRHQDGPDFLQQLRLGLIPTEGTET